MARAYLELERAGIVNRRQGSGTYVAQHPPTVTRGQRQRILAERADAFLTETLELGVELEEAIALLRSRFEKMLANTR